MKAVTQNVWVLKIRWSGEEDDVYLFTDKEKAESFAMHNYFDGYTDGVWQGIEEYNTFIHEKDIGYFDIFLQCVK